MARYNSNRMPYADQEKLLTLLCKVLHALGKPEAMRDFLKDLLNRDERVMLVRRLLVADRLLKGHTYERIKHDLRVGSSTISRVDRWLHFGRGGYKRAIEKLKKAG